MAVIAVAFLAWAFWPEGVGDQLVLPSDDSLVGVARDYFRD
jgi:hypothetical protein